MQYTDNEAALIGGLISNYFFQPSVDAKLRESYRRVLRHLQENTLSASDLSRIQNAPCSRTLSSKSKLLVCRAELSPVPRKRNIPGSLR